MAPRFAGGFAAVDALISVVAFIVPHSQFTRRRITADRDYISGGLS